MDRNRRRVRTLRQLELLLGSAEVAHGDVRARGVVRKLERLVNGLLQHSRGERFGCEPETLPRQSGAKW